MSRPLRIIRNIAIGLAAFLLLALVAVFLVVQTAWFRDFARQKIIAAVADGTGGRVEIASFTFDPAHLRAVLTGIVIHGKEPAGAAPYLQARRAQVDIRLFTHLQFFNIAYLGLEAPQANIMIFPDGTTNIPEPKTKSTSNTTSLETVVDLAVGRADISHGLVTFNSQQHPLDIRANNLHVQLAYNILKQGYQGEISLQPLYVANGRNTPVNFTISLPLALHRDRIDFDNARISTDRSQLTITGSLQNLRNPKTDAHVNGHLALADLKALGNLPVVLNAPNTPRTVDLDATASMANNTIQIAGLRLGIGNSNLEASGTLKDPSGNSALQFKGTFALGELGRLAGVAQRPEGTATANGTVKLDAANNYQLAGNIAATAVSIQQGARRLQNINLSSAIRLDPHTLNLDGLRLAAFGAEVTANASLQDFARFQLDGNLRGLDLHTAMQTAGVNLPYDGNVSGPISAQGDLKAPGTSTLAARARLSIAPGRRGIPVSGKLNANYDGRTDNISVGDSFVALPHSRVTLSGSLGTRLDVGLTSRDLNDFLAALPAAQQPQVALVGGQLTLTAAVNGRLSSPQIAGHVAMDHFRVEARRFDSFAADISATSAGASVSNGTLSRASMQAQFQASVGLHDWNATPNQPLQLQANIQSGDVADAMVLAGQPSAGYSGALTATADVKGTVGNPTGTANLNVANGTLHNEPIDNLQLQVIMADQLIVVPTGTLSSGAGTVTFSAEFHHPADTFSAGQIHAHLQSGQVDLSRVHTIQQEQPNSGGQLQISADMNADVVPANTPGATQTGIVPSNITADIAAHGLSFQGQNYGDLAGTARTSGQTVTYNLTSNFAGSNVHVDGNTKLTQGYPTTADATIARLPIDRVLALAKQNIPARGTLGGTVHLTGTTEHPTGNVNLDLAGANIYGEPIDHIRARIDYAVDSIDVPQFQIVAGASHIDLTARYDHPAQRLQSGSLQFKINSSSIDLARIRNVQNARPGLGGTLEIAANGAGTVSPGGARIAFRDLTADISARGIKAEGRNFGDLTFNTRTNAGRATFALDSNIAGSAIHGSGSAQLSGEYPLNAKLTFDNIAWTRLEPLITPGGSSPDFEALVAGALDVNGPAANANALQGTLQVTRVQVRTTPKGTAARPVAIENQGPIVLALEKGVARLQSLHLAGSQADFQASGSYALQSGALTGSVKSNVNLAVLQQFSRQVFSSGSIALNADLRGTADKPSLNGRLEFHDASVNYSDIPNGISNANGVVQFSGNSASVQRLVAEVGGGKVTISGYAAYRDVLRFGIRVNASNVLVRAQPGVSILTDANLQLAGSLHSSLISGSVVINQLTYSTSSDVGSILSRAAPSVVNATAPSPLLDNMKLDVQVRTSPSIAVQADMAENLSLTSNMQVRGNLPNPIVLGRVTITGGRLLFFGNTYTVNSGTISFLNPVRIQPELNLSLETQSQGVDVVLKVSGPIDNMNLSYTSDPPLQFQEIVGLLATGKTPSTDPNILVNQPTQNSQSFQQMGESAIVSKAVAGPIASRLQRVFGVSQLSIDPTFSGGNDLPQAQLTLKQRITSNMTFTYVTAIDNPNTQIINVQFAVNPQWSAIAGRDENGIVSVRFIYKKQFR